MKVVNVVQAAVVVVVGAVSAGALAQGPETERQITQLAASRHEGQENGWPHLQRALAAAGQAQREANERWEAAGRPGEEPAVIASELLSGPLPREGTEHGVWYVRRAGELGAFEALKELARVGQAWQPPEEAAAAAAGHEAMMERLQRSSSVRELARLTAAAMRLAAVEGDEDEQVAMFDASLALAAATADRLMVLDRLVAEALVRLGLREARLEIVEGLIDGDVAERMLGVIDERLPLAPLEASRRPEAVQAVGMMQEMAGGEAPVEMDGMVEAVVEASREEAPAEAEPAGNEFDPAVVAQFLAGTVRDAMSHVSGIEPQSQMHAEGTRIVLALEVHAAREGVYPESLAALAPEILPEVPGDALSGLAFGYRRLQEPDQHGRGYLLWSAGADGEDNGGQPHPKGSHLAQTDRGAGFDIVLNEPRQEVE